MLAFGGVTLAGCLSGVGMAMFPGLWHRSERRAALLVYHAVAFAGIGMVALAGLALVMNLFLMYASGEPAEYSVPGASAAAAVGQ